MNGTVKKRLGDMLIRVGAVVGTLGAAAMLTPGMQEVFFYKGMFAASAVMLILGAWYGRQGRIEQEEEKKLAELGAPSEMELADEPVASRDRRTTS